MVYYGGEHWYVGPSKNLSPIVGKALLATSTQLVFTARPAQRIVTVGGLSEGTAAFSPTQFSLLRRSTHSLATVVDGAHDSVLARGGLLDLARARGGGGKFLKIAILGS